MVLTNSALRHASSLGESSSHAGGSARTNHRETVEAASLAGSDMPSGTHEFTIDRVESTLAQQMLGDEIPFSVNGKITNHMLEHLSGESGRNFAHAWMSPEAFRAKVGLTGDYFHFGGRPRVADPNGWDKPDMDFVATHRPPPTSPLESLDLKMRTAVSEVTQDEQTASHLKIPVGAIIADIERATPFERKGWGRLAQAVFKKEEEAPLNIGVSIYLPTHCSSGEGMERIDKRTLMVRISMQVTGSDADKIENEFSNPEFVRDALVSLLAHPPKDSASGSAFRWLKEAALEPGAKAAGKSLAEFLEQNFAVGRIDDEVVYSRFRSKLKSES